MLRSTWYTSMNTYDGDDAPQDALINGQWVKVPGDLDVAKLEDSAVFVQRFVVTLESSRRP